MIVAEVTHPTSDSLNEQASKNLPPRVEFDAGSIPSHDIDFTVHLSGSVLFDWHVYATAQKLCTKFPGLQFTYDGSGKFIKITGKLNDHWFDEWNKQVFQLGFAD